MRVRKPMKQMSDRRKAEMPAREAICRQVRREQLYRCGGNLEGCTGDIAHVHEFIPRSAGRFTGSITNRENCIGLCERCHRWIHDNPAMAMEIGLKVSRYEGRRI